MATTTKPDCATTIGVPALPPTPVPSLKPLLALPRGTTFPANNITQYQYHPHGALSQITYPDNKTRQYLYEDTRPSNSYALTGILDENNNRFATITYDPYSRAPSTEHANGVEKTTLSYNVDGNTTTTLIGYNNQQRIHYR